MASRTIACGSFGLKSPPTSRQSCRFTGKPLSAATGLMHLAAETALLGAYGIIPPSYGTSYSQVNILGLDLNSYANPLVTASFSLPFYIGFLGLGLMGGGLVIKSICERRKRMEQKGVQAIFTS